MCRSIWFFAFAVFFSAVGVAKSVTDTDRTAVFPAERAADFVQAVCYRPPNATDYWTPAEKDLVGVEDGLLEYLRSQGVDDHRDWAKFRRQVAGVGLGDERLLFIYYFYFDEGIEKDLAARKVPNYDPDSWKKKPYVVADGGSWFFRVLYDIRKKKFIWYECNGVG